MTEDTMSKTLKHPVETCADLLVTACRSEDKCFEWRKVKVGDYWVIVFRDDTPLPVNLPTSTIGTFAGITQYVAG